MWECSSANTVGRETFTAIAQFSPADERISDEACLVQTPTLPGLVSEGIG